MNTEDRRLELADFKAIMKEQGNMYMNHQGVDIDLSDEVSARIQIWDKGPTAFDLVLDMDAGDFMEEFEIQCWEDVEAIDEAALWEQFKKGNAYVCAGLFEFLEMDICFRVTEGKILVYSDPEGIYGDKLDTVSTHVERFRAYVQVNMSRLYDASEKIDG